MMSKAHSGMGHGYFMSKAISNPNRAGFMGKLPPPNLTGRKMRLQPMSPEPRKSSLERY